MVYRSPAAQRHRETQRERRANVQQRVLALAERRGWPRGVVGSMMVLSEASWRGAVGAPARASCGSRSAGCESLRV